MKALLFVSHMILVSGQPHIDTSTNQIDADDCNEPLTQVIAAYGLKNHVTSSGPTYIKAHNKDESVTVTCKPISK